MGGSAPALSILCLMLLHLRHPYSFDAKWTSRDHERPSANLIPSAYMSSNGCKERPRRRNANFGTFVPVRARSGDGSLQQRRLDDFLGVCFR